MLISIYPTPGGEPREIRAEADMAPSGPFDSPSVIAGRLIAPLPDTEFAQIEASEVLYEGETYVFERLDSQGSFKLRKAW